MQEDEQIAKNKANITKQKIAKLYNLILHIDFYFCEPNSFQSNTNLDKYKEFYKEITNSKVPISSLKEIELDRCIYNLDRIMNSLYSNDPNNKLPQKKNELIKQFQEFKALHYYKETIKIFNILKKNRRWNESLNNIEYDLAINLNKFKTTLSQEKKDQTYQQIERIYFAIKSHHSTL